MKLDGKTITWDLKPFELYFPDWIDAIDQRKSVRIFDQQPIPQDVASSLEDMAARLSQVVPGFRIYVDAKPADGVFVMQSGRFRGTSGFAAFMTKYGWEEVSQALGFLGEWFILHATSLGLSTCWANAAVSMSGVLQRVSVTAGESVICLVPFGYPGKPTRTPKTRKRMKWKSICPQYETGELEPWQMAAFEAAKWAPSALNGQPWQFAVRGNQIVVRKRNNMAGVSRWMEMDFGVVMSHIHLIAAASGHPGVWTWGTYPEIATYTFEEKAD